MRKSQDYVVRGGFSTAANAGGALRCDVAADMHEYALLHKRVRVRVTVDGGQTRHSAFSRRCGGSVSEKPLTCLSDMCAGKGEGASSLFSDYTRVCNNKK
jgi:hypothetical protein